MGLFGKKKTYEELLEQAKALMAEGERTKACLVLFKINGKDDGTADYLLGQCYYLDFQDRGKKGDWKNAKYYYTQAAKEGHLQATQMLAQEFGIRDYLPQGAAGQAEIEEDQVEEIFGAGMDAYGREDYAAALELFLQAAQLGHVVAQFNCAIMYDSGRGVEADQKKAVYWYEKAAEQGDPDAQNNLGVMYRNGDGVEVDYKKSIYWFQKAAEQGQVEGFYNCGIMYDNGLGVEPDAQKTLYWFEKAADQGHERAQFNCGIMYENGEGTEVDLEKALYWYEKAADQGHAKAQFTCGRMYFLGAGTEQNAVTALGWLLLAAEQGMRDAMEAVVRIYGELDSIPEKDYPLVMRYLQELDDPELWALAPAMEEKREQSAADRAESERKAQEARLAAQAEAEQPLLVTTGLVCNIEDPDALRPQRGERFFEERPAKSGGDALSWLEKSTAKDREDGQRYLRDRF